MVAKMKAEKKKEMRLKALLKIETRTTGESRQRERGGGDSLSK